MRTWWPSFVILAACGGNHAGGPDAAPGDGARNADARPAPIDLCAGLVQDLQPRAMTALAKPAVGGTVTDAEFGTTIRRVSDAAAAGGYAIVPMYSTVPAWNADESRLLLYDVGAGNYRLYDGKTYAFLRTLDLSPPDLEQVYWHGSDPDLLLYVENTTLVRYHVSTGVKEPLHTFEFCTGGATGGSDPMAPSFDTNRFGLKCDDQVFVYDVAQGQVLGRQTLAENPAQIAPSGALAYLSDSGRVTDPTLAVQRTLDLKEPFGHASMGIWPTGEDTWNGQVFDPGPGGDDDIGNLVTFDLTRGTSKTIIGPKTGYPYPPDGHISALALRQPGWAVVSTFGNTSGAGLLDLETLVADTVSGKVCRVGRHRSWGKANTMLADSYWAEAHAVPSPSGTRIAFASDWGNGATVDTYVIELPSYQP